MNENALSAATAFLRMIPGSVRTGRAVHAFDRATFQLNKQKHENSNKTHQPLAFALRFFYSDNCALLVCAFAAAQSTMPKRVWRRWKHSSGR